ncbi:unnamed protein product (macronuclear) [Paramecium tetraurelia]|uniref:Uncharacterized protein n=1 Tax=Paramecium tetraurelia TaxID=5888 RepID=A0BPQ3_PARTE|nr:uncharacterized protein GSPATT00005270001 [Paramecium tetraurelia]CAK60520.1 unnamed protein product [Paramecium tetraurelia]|eukprot:XP_001427918.1 hypothetical protein (macronuclear) [Paramecium tetraurelia strain d4-2]
MTDAENLNDQFVIETLQNLLIEYNEPYVEKRARICGQSDDYQSEFFVSLEQITKNEQTIKNLIELCMFILDKAQQSNFEREEDMAQHEEQINQLQEKINFESKNSKEYQKMYKEEAQKVKEQLSEIQKLEQSVQDYANELAILNQNQKHRLSEQKFKNVEQNDNKIIEDLKQQISIQKAENIKQKEKIDYYKSLYDKQMTELEDALNELAVLRMEKIKNDSKVKASEQEISKLNQIIMDYEQKSQIADLKIGQLNKQIYDLQNASGYKFDGDIHGSMIQRNSISTSTFQQQNQQTASFNNNNSMVSNAINSNLKCDLPELSYRQPHPSQFNEIEEIKEAPENLEQSAMHSKKNTVIPPEFVQNQNQQYDIQKLEEKLQKLATPRQLVTPRGQANVTPRNVISKAVQESQELRAAKLQDKFKQSQINLTSPRIQLPQLQVTKLDLQKQEDSQWKLQQQEPQPITIRNEIDIGSIVDDDYETYFYEEKVKAPQAKKQFKLPLLSIGANGGNQQTQEGSNQQASQLQQTQIAQQTQQQQQAQQSQQQQNQQGVQQQQNQSKLISAPHQMYKEIYQANEAYFLNMKQDQIKITTQIDRGLRQSMIQTGIGGGKPTNKRDPYREFFDLLCQCVKLNSDYFDDIVYIDTQNYYQECKASGKPFNEWEDWIRSRLESQVDFSD